MIISKVRKPSIRPSGKKKKTITKKELETIKHLEKTCEVVGNLSQNDIKAIKLLNRKQEEKERE